MYLARELESCNEQRLVCEQIFVHCCRCVNELADNSIRMVQQLLDKPEIKSCRIPLEIDYEKMTDPDYWLKSELFCTPFKDRSEPLGQKIVQLVNMLRALKLKIQEVDTDYAEKVFKRMAARQKKSTNIFDYEIWRKRHPHPTMKQLEQQQVQLTAKMLIAGIMEYDEDAKDYEVAQVQLELVKRDLIYGQKLPDNFKEECAKLRRYSYWKGEHLFMINYKEIYTYLFSHCFDKFTEEQHIALYEYDVQLKMIHEDMVKLQPELGKYLYDNKNLASLENTKLFAPYLHIKEMLKGEWFRKLRIDTKYNDKWADAFAEALIRSEYGSHIAEDWKVKDYKIKGYVIGCLKEAGVFMANVSNDSIAKDAAIISKTRTFGKYIGADSQKQPYAEWIRKHVDDYCK
jgi:hypothetical protein